VNPSDTARIILVTGKERVPKEACDLISSRPGFEVRRVPDDNLDAARLHEALAGASGYLIGGDEKPLAEHFDRAVSLEAVAWLGTDFRGNVPGWERAFERGIAFISTPGENAISVAEFALLLILTMARPFTEHVNRPAPEAADEALTKRNNLSPGVQLHGKTLGILGAGRIGARVAKAATQGLGMDVLYAAPRRNEPLEAALAARHVTLTELLENSHVVSLHRPGPAAGEPPVLGEAQLQRVRRGALLVNTAHHDLVDPDALLWAIEHRGLRAAFDGIGEGSAWVRLAALGPSQFLSVPPMGDLTEEARQRISRKAAEAVCQVLLGNDSALVNNPGFRDDRRR
jgi:D-3-phosphoglycerate dehydrogenase